MWFETDSENRWNKKTGNRILNPGFYERWLSKVRGVLYYQLGFCRLSVTDINFPYIQSLLYRVNRSHSLLQPTSFLSDRF